MDQSRKRQQSRDSCDNRDLIEEIQGIREPLSVISGAAHYLEIKLVNMAEKEARHIEIIKEQIKRVDERINEIINGLPAPR
ncbi:MAG TPA: hypothetical protein VKM55_24225 [Candidatus Lokiarchaeia archaeon]|nr:hypothetical protein [Candidatus Lokiarchaeia archaeon]